jgi:hypothetical protein
MSASENKENNGSSGSTFRSVLSNLKDRTPPIIYFTAVLIAMVGWLYFIGRLLWHFAVWTFS